MLVALGFWPRPGEGRRQWPGGRFIVVTDDMPRARLELRMLAGAVPIVAANKARLARARELALLLTRVEPLHSWVYVLLYDIGVFAAVRAPDDWEELTWSAEDYWQPLATDLQAMATQRDERAAGA